MNSRALLAGFAASAITLVCLAQTPAKKAPAQKTPAKKGSSLVKAQPFGQMPDGTPVEIFTLTNSAGMTARITNLWRRGGFADRAR